MMKTVLMWLLTLTCTDPGRGGPRSVEGAQGEDVRSVRHREAVPGGGERRRSHRRHGRPVEDEVHLRSAGGDGCGERDRPGHHGAIAQPGKPGRDLRRWSRRSGRRGIGDGRIGCHRSRIGPGCRGGVLGCTAATRKSSGDGEGSESMEHESVAS